MTRRVVASVVVLLGCFPAVVGLGLVSAGRAATLPFIGCPADGQGGPLPAPRGRAPDLALPLALIHRLAYYASDDMAVLGPAGWHCFSLYGSNGSSLYVTPEARDLNSLQAGLSGFAIQFSTSLGGTSGRFEVAKIAASLFPSARQFVRRVIDEGLEPASDFPSRPAPTDRIEHLGPDAVRYETPADTDGLGTRSRLRKAAQPIGGAVILLPKDEMDLLYLAIRLPPELRDLQPVITRQVLASHGIAAAP